jgi:hypothetical protein
MVRVPDEPVNKLQFPPRTFGSNVPDRILTSPAVWNDA